MSPKPVARSNENSMTRFLHTVEWLGNARKPSGTSKKKYGVMKVGAFTDANLLDLQQCLKEQGLNAGRIFGDEKLGIDLLQVTDPEQNTLEIISRVIQ